MNLIEKVVKVSSNLFCSMFKRKPKVMSSDETIDYILKNKVSIGRYGDGELDSLLGDDLKFQKANAELSRKLKEVKTDEKFLTCIPNIFEKKYFNRKLLTKLEYNFWFKHKLLHEHTWKKYFRKQVCGDAFVSRFYIRYNDKSHVPETIEKLQKVWDKRNLIIVEGENSKIGCENDLLSNANSIRRIIGPSFNAYDYYDEIMNAVKSNYHENDLVLIALGPTATVMAYDLSRENIQALDLGHFDIEYEWFLAKADKKIPVKNKHVNECDDNGNNNSEDVKYKSQIIDKILKRKNNNEKI